ncbi:hypothetical protein GCM10023238_32710 [Streptomyces heliomycini]
MEPVWSSKSEQITVPAQSSPGGGVVVGGVVGGVVPSSPHGTPLRAKSLGAGSAERQVPCRPNSAAPPVGRAPFQFLLVATTDPPVWVTVAFHAEVTRWSPV